MPKAKTSRKQLFRAALAIVGMTTEQWAQKEGVTAAYISMILSRKRKSEELEAKIDAFIDKHLISRQHALAS
jgi:hypothetical protein